MVHQLQWETDTRELSIVTSAEINSIEPANQGHWNQEIGTRGIVQQQPALLFLYDARRSVLKKLTEQLHQILNTGLFISHSKPLILNKDINIVKGR